MSYRPIRDYGADGMLERAGYEWEESKYSAAANALIFGVLGLIAVLVGLFFVLAGKVLGYLPLILGALVVWQCYAWRKNDSAQKRAFIFTADGGTLAPHGLSGLPNYKPGYIQHADIASIEAHQNEGVLAYAVIILRNGSTIRLADSVTENELQMIVVQLNLALSEMRAYLAGSLKGNVREVVIE